jgi:predicted nucleotidyltransferase
MKEDGTGKPPSGGASSSTGGTGEKVPSEVTACPAAAAADEIAGAGPKEREVIQTANREEQIDELTKRIPGLGREQANVLLEEAANRGASRVVFGGSRVRGNHHEGSDLDVGFDFPGRGKNNACNQARSVIEKGSEVEGGLPLENGIAIVTGNKTKNVDEIKSPEEFFQRSGTRSDRDPKAGQPYEASGSISASSDGKTVTVIPAGAPLINNQ